MVSLFSGLKQGGLDELFLQHKRPYQTSTITIIACDSNRVLLLLVAPMCLACLFFFGFCTDGCLWPSGPLGSLPLRFPSHNIFPSQLPFDFAMSQYLPVHTVSTLISFHSHARLCKLSYPSSLHTHIPHISTKTPSTLGDIVCRRSNIFWVHHNHTVALFFFLFFSGHCPSIHSLASLSRWDDGSMTHYFFFLARAKREEKTPARYENDERKKG